MKVDVDFVIREFRRGEADTDPYDAIDALVSEVERLRGELEEAHLARIKAQNPGIGMDRSRRERGARA